MNISTTSECSSGCESGWTMYLDQSSNSEHHQFHRSTGDGFVDRDGHRSKVAEEEDAEDLSMVSDASSGPPHFHEDDEDCFDDNNGHFSYAYSASQKAKKKSIQHKGHHQQHTYLDDTASSPVLSYSKKNIALASNESSMGHALGFSQGFSTTHFKGKSAAFRKHFGSLKSSVPGKPDSGAAGGLQGRK